MSVGALLQITAYGVPQMIIGRMSLSLAALLGSLANRLDCRRHWWHRKRSERMNLSISVKLALADRHNQTSTAPVWQSETSKVAWRGKLIVIELILNIAGFSLSNWVTYGFSFIPGAVAWRVPLALQFMFIVVLYCTVPWLPESPRWLVQKGRIEEAELILADVEGTSIEDPYVQTELSEIKFSTAYERENSVRIRDLLMGKHTSAQGTSTLRRIILGMGAQAMQQLSGINLTSYYLPTVLIESVGFGESMARLLAACNSVSYLLFSLIGIPNVERWGRRKMLMFAAAGQGFCYLMISILLGLADRPVASADKFASASVAFFFLYYVFFGIGFQGVPWLYPSEINGLAMRSKGAALGTATNWIFNFMVRREESTAPTNLADNIIGSGSNPCRHPESRMALLHRLDGIQLQLRK